LAQLPLGGFEPRATPSRFAVGAVVCTGGSAAFGTSDFAGGYEIDPTNLDLRGALDGVPVARSTQDWLLVDLPDGLPQWTMGTTARWNHLGGLLKVFTDPTGQVFDGDRRLGQSGLGATASRREDALIWVRTGLNSWGADDEVQLAVDDRMLGEPVALPGSVRATALGQFAGPAWSLLIAQDLDQRTILRSLRVVLP
ncbi:MAG: hypothetical protein AAF449_06760, partial [Myxococcota bacterium]